VDVGPVEKLVEKLAEEGRGVTVRPVSRGASMSGLAARHTQQVDGWEVGYVTPWGSGDLGAGATLAEAVEAALRALEHGS
jgi:hypothetical protein